ncbi:PilZ domain-containing protein, partial [Sphingomonas sp. SRS2]|uniref:PilZ domain-containing protein n=1 Tax=Sphingomonas sp. SRS2 TaxID=133190 RepID=UPI0006183F6D
MYSSEVLVRDGKSRRAAPRVGSAFDTDLRGRQGTARSPCRIIDISSGGARLMIYQDLSPETSIQLALPGKGLVDAHIVWANGREAGCRFDSPIDAVTVTMVQAKS